jgi:hypothetical protein
MSIQTERSDFRARLRFGEQTPQALKRARTFAARGVNITPIELERTHRSSLIATRCPLCGQRTKFCIAAKRGQVPATEVGQLQHHLRHTAARRHPGNPASPKPSDNRASSGRRSGRFCEVGLGTIKKFRTSEYVFPRGVRPGKARSSMALETVRRRAQVDATAHVSKVPLEIRQTSAFHSRMKSPREHWRTSSAIGGAVQSTGDALNKRRRLMNAWADYCNGSEASSVLMFKAHRLP